MYQDIKYDFTAELTGTWDRSEYNIEDYYWSDIVFNKDTDIEAQRSLCLS